MSNLSSSDEVTPRHHVAKLPHDMLRGVSAWQLIIKRIIDVLGSFIGLVILGPLLFIPIALIIKLDSPGPVFYRQTRNGWNGTFTILKFRSMTEAASKSEFKQAVAGDARITRVGVYLRRYNIDELPQLWNVFVGDMSLVGPRPHPIALDEKYSASIPGFFKRYCLRPGLSGWAQIHGLRGETSTLEQMANRVRYDQEYIANWSLKLDLFILIRTLFSKKAYDNAH